jgi:hypothetical protein
MAGKRTKALKDEICERLSIGEPLRQICRDEHMPSWVNVYRWIKQDEALALRIAQARELGFDAIAEEAMSIADTPVEGETTKTTETGTEVTRADMLGHRKLQIETRLKLLAKWSPKKYGDSTRLEHTGKMTLEQLIAGSNDGAE